MERYDEVLADLSRAIELAREAAWPLFWRGTTYRLMERYDEALADLDCAIELSPSNDDYAAERAEIQLLVERTRPTDLRTAPLCGFTHG
jgi:tetratricopeptide (TPR) repeat protein